MLLSLVSLGVAHGSAGIDLDIDIRFTDFKRQFHKKYHSAEEDEYRKSVFQDNMKFADDANATGENNYTLGVTHFADMTHEEYKQLLTEQIFDARNGAASVLGAEDNTVFDFKEQQIVDDVPEEHKYTKFLPTYPAVDWVERGAVNEPEQQGKCGSCWSFATTGALEGAFYVVHKELIQLSEQELLDCDNVANHQCSGGLPAHAFDFVQSHGLCARDEYPYVCQKEHFPKCEKKICKHCAARVKAGDVLTKYQLIQTPGGLMSGLNQAPTTVAIDASSKDFMLYTGGVFDKCREKINLNHAALAVGYKEGAFWKVKNSWGTAWGENGYFRLAWGNTCGVLEYAVIPILKGEYRADKSHHEDEEVEILIQ